MEGASEREWEVNTRQGEAVMMVVTGHSIHRQTSLIINRLTDTHIN